MRIIEGLAFNYLAIDNDIIKTQDIIAEGKRFGGIIGGVQMKNRYLITMYNYDIVEHFLKKYKKRR